MSQELSKNYSDKLVKINFFILGGSEKPRVHKYFCPQLRGRKWLRQFYGRLGLFGSFCQEKTPMLIKFFVLGAGGYFLGGGGVPIFSTGCRDFSEWSLGVDLPPLMQRLVCRIGRVLNGMRRKQWKLANSSEKLRISARTCIPQIGAKKWTQTFFLKLFRQKSRGIPPKSFYLGNFSAPTPSRGRPPPHRKTFWPKSISRNCILANRSRKL